MPELDQLFDKRRGQPPYPLVQEGELVTKDGDLYARVDVALIGPVIDGTGGDAEAGKTALVCVSQDGRPWIVGVE